MSHTQRLIIVVCGCIVLGITSGFPQAINLRVVSPVNNGSPVAAGTPFSVTVISQDALNSPTPVILSTTVTLTLGQGNGILDGTLVGSIPAGMGSAIFSNVTYTKAEPGVSVTATSSGGDILLPGSSSSFVVGPGAATQLAFLQQSTTTPAGTSMSPAVSVAIEDALGNVVTTDNSTSITLTIGTNPGGGTLSGGGSTAAVNGVATFSGLSIDKPGNGYTLTANDGSLTSATTTSFNITPGGASKVVITQQPPSSRAAGASFSVQVTVEDALGNTVTSDGSTVSLAIGTNPGGGTLSGTTSHAVSGGVYQFTGLSIDKTGNGYTIIASDGSLTSAVSNSFNIIAAAASTVGVETASDGTGSVVGSQNVTAGSSVTMYAITRDQFRNFVANVGADAWSYQSSGGGVVAGDLVPAVGNKSAVFTGHVTGTAAVKATSSSLTTTGTGTLTVTPGPISQIIVENAGNSTGIPVPKQSVTSGSTLKVYANSHDPYGNFVANIAATWLLINRTGGMVAGDLVTDVGSKSATFTGKVTGTARIQATSGTLTAVPSDTITVVNGSASKLAFGVQPTTVTSGRAIKPAVTVQVQDVAGNLVPTDTRAVTLSIGTNPGGGSLGGFPAKSAIAGAAAFDSVTIDKKGTGYTLFASSSPGLTLATSSAFDVQTGPANGIAKVSGDIQTNFILQQLSPFVVKVTDVGGNPVSGQSVAFNRTGRPLGATTDTLSVKNATTDASGQASTVLTLGEKVGNYVTTASSGSLSGSPLTFTASASVGQAAILALVSGDNQSGTVFSALPLPFVVSVTDAGGNPVSSKTVSYVSNTFPSGSPGVSNPSSATTDGRGIASSVFTPGSKAGNYVVDARVTGLTGSPVSFHASVQAGTAAHVTKASGDAQAGIVGASLPVSLTVQVTDLGFNNVPGDTVNFAVATSPSNNAAVNPGTAVTGSDGLASTILTLGQTPGTYTVNASVVGVAGGTVTFDETANADVPFQLSFLVPPGTVGTAGVALTPIKVRLLDRYQNVVQKAGVPISLSISSGNVGTPSGTLTQLTDATGIATFGDLVFVSAGTGQLQATSTSLASVSSGAFTIVSAGVDTLLFSRSPSNSAAGSIFLTQPVVELRDRFGNPVKNAGGTVSVDLTLPVISGAFLSGTKTAVVDTNGQAVFTNLSVSRAGTYTLSAARAGVTKPSTSSNFSISASTAYTLGFTRQPQDTVAGARMQPSITVAVQDSFGNVVPTATSQITLSLLGGGSLPVGSNVKFASAGVASFDSLVIIIAGTGKQLAAASPGLKSDSSAVFAIRAAAATRLVFTSQPDTGVAGTPFAQQPVLALEDQFTNVVTGTAQTVTIGIQDTATRGASLLGSTKSVPLDTATGKATFFGLSIDKSGLKYTLTAAGNTVSTIRGTTVSNPFSVGAGAAMKVRVETAANGSGTILGKQNVSSGTSIAVYAVARDSFDNYIGNIASDANGWNLLFTSGGVAQSDLVPSGDRRSAVFTGKLVGQTRINAAVVGLRSFPTDTLTIVQAGFTAKIIVETANNGTGQRIPPQSLQSGLSIRAYAIGRDAASNFVANMAAAWSLVKASGGVADTDLVPSQDGKSAVFHGRKVGKAILVAASGSLVQTTSDTISVIPGGVAKLIAVNGTTPQSAPVGTVFAVPLAAQVRDSSDNPIPNVLVRFTAPTTDPTSIFGSRTDTTALSNATGIAIAPPCKATNKAGSYEDTANVRGAVAALFSLSNVAGTVAGFNVVSSSSGAFGTQYTQAPFPVRITARDPSGNVASTFAGTADVSSDGILSEGGGTSPAFTNGILASLPVAFNSAGTYTLSVTRTGGTETGRSDTIVVLNPSPTVSSLSPTNGRAGQILDVVVQGSGFLKGVTVVIAGDSKIRISTIVNSYTQLTATLRIDSSIVPGAKDITIANLPPGGGTYAVSNGLIVGNNPLPTVSSVLPNSALRYQTLNVGLTGTSFYGGTTTVNFGTGLTVNSTIVDSQSHITASITISGAADLGPRQVSVTNGPPGGGTSGTVTFTVNLENAAPPILSSPLNGSSSHSLSSVILQWKPPPTGASTYHVQVSNLADFSTLLVNDSTIIALRDSLGSLTSYTVYFWRVRAKLQNGAPSSFSGPWQFNTIPATFTAAATITFPGLANPGDYSPNDYRIVGLPGNDRTSFSKFLQGVHGQDWTAYWDNGRAESYLQEYSATDTLFTFSTGRAFWILYRGVLSLGGTVASSFPDTTGLMRIPLHTGWNLITNPLPQPIPWAQVQKINGGIGDSIWTFDGSTMSVSSTFVPYSGYYFENKNGLSSLIVPFGGSLAKTASMTVSSDSAWTCTLSLERAGIVVDRSTWFGTARDAGRGPNRYAFHKPRAIGALSQLFFDHPEWDSVAGRFASDVRQPTGRLETWDIAVRLADPARRTDTHTMKIQGVDYIPSKNAVFVLDRARGRYHDLRVDRSYSFVPGAVRTTLQIVVGDPEEVQNELGSLAPKEFSLEQNYPNPFNPVTIIPVDIPYSVSVSVRIYNVLGQEVATLQDGQLVPGRYLFHWDGTNVLGSRVGTGAYFCRMSVSGGPTLIRKMLLLR